MAEAFGHPPSDAFADVKQHLVLQLLAGILSAEQRVMCLAVMCAVQRMSPGVTLIIGKGWSGKSIKIADL